MTDSNSDTVPMVPLSDDDARGLDLLKRFSQQFGQQPILIARAPGRVNLIGEHIDYMGYGVLPMAIQQDVMIAGRVCQSPDIKVHNVDPKYKPFECKSTSHSFSINTQCPEWYNYFLAGYCGIVEHLGMAEEPEKPGLELMVCGKIPPSAGLSSSSALVCASALIVSKLYSTKDIPKTEYAQICCDCEKYVGTQGGGMDQAISFLAEPNKAKMIDFDPVRATDVRLPEGYVFVISHSLAEINKAATTDFNQRVIECKLACQVLAHHLGQPWQEFQKLGDLQKKSGKTFDEMLELVEKHLHKEVYNEEEICKTLSASAEDLNKATLIDNKSNVTEFKLYQRAKHVFSEAKRVLQFKEICDKGAADAAKQLGQLMNESHASTRDLYECSHPDLDALVDICLNSGALGSRLTGAGWGGCAVSIVKDSDVESFLSKVKSQYYNSQKLGERDINEVLFQTAPAKGACFFDLQMTGTP